MGDDLSLDGPGRRIRTRCSGSTCPTRALPPHPSVSWVRLWSPTHIGLRRRVNVQGGSATTRLAC